MKPVITFIFLAAAVCAAALDFKPGNREATLETKRLRAVVRDGRIIHLENRKTGQIYADRKLNEWSMTSGLGYMTGKEKELSKLHFPWGEPGLNQHILLRKTDLYHYPNEKSIYSAKKSGKEVILSWKGLSDGKQFFADETLSIHFTEDPSGALVFLGKGYSPRKGVFAVQIPLENIPPDSTFLLPTFGGLEYKGTGTKGLLTFQSTIMFYEAPMMVCTIGKDSLGMWCEDARFRDFFAFFTRNKKSCSFALEFLNLIPFEQHNRSISNPVKLDVFENSGWIAAARPYRNWYQKTFAKEIAIRDSGWADNISVICDIVAGGKSLKELAAMMPPERVLFHVWQARKEGFTTNLPDYTPKKNYPAAVANYHAHGFKVMCYTCALCVTYGRKLWKQDKLENVVFARRTSVTNYNGTHAAFDENLVGNIVKSEKGKNPFASLKPGRLIYTDPLSPKWRNYYTDKIKEFNRVTETDANYQDTLGCTEDVGNGIVDGMRGAEGNAALSRLLQQKVGVPMASEFGPAPIAFAVKWPLNQTSVWGSHRFRVSRIHRHRPLTPFLFGYRTWIPVIRTNTDMLKHMACAASDSLSGMGLFTWARDMQNNEGFDGHMVLRSQVFAKYGLKPYYPQEKRYPQNIRAMYKSKDGKIFRYYDDGKLQMMLDPAGKPLYGRANGVTEIKRSDLVYPRWPIQDDNGIYSLDPKKYHALFPKGVSKRPKLQIKPLAKDTVINAFYETDDFIYLELGSNAKNKNGNASVTVTVPAGFTNVICNDSYQNVKAGKNVFRGKFPLRLIFSNGKTTKPSLVRKINKTSGLQVGPAESLGMQRNIGGTTAYFINYFNAKSLDFIVKVQKPTDALEMVLQNTQSRYGNGSTVELLINGKRAAFLDCYTLNPKWTKKSKVRKFIWNTTPYKWTVPVGRFAGKNILVTLRVSDKNSTNADSQWVSIPKIVTAQKQVFKQEIVKAPPRPVKSAVKPRPAGKVVSALRPDLPSKAVVPAGKDVYAYTPQASHGLIYGTKTHRIDRAKRYYLSGELSSDAAKNHVYIGVMEFDAKGRAIHGVHINPVRNTLTRLSHPAVKGSKKILVMDASNWSPGNMVAFHASENIKDLPNMMLAGPVEHIRKGGNDWTLTLKRPLTFSVQSDSLVRQHRDMSTYNYLYSGVVGKKWKPFGSEIKWRPGAVSFRWLIIGRKPLKFKNMKIELYQK